MVRKELKMRCCDGGNFGLRSERTSLRMGNVSKIGIEKWPIGVFRGTLNPSGGSCRQQL